MPMQTSSIHRCLLTRTAVMMTAALLGSSPAWAQTPPTPTHTFQPAGSSGTFGTAGNWSPGLPGAGNQVLIADGKTANGMTQTEGNTLFGSLTLGVGSTLNLAASNTSGTSGLAAGSLLYFSNGSQLNYTSGDTNQTNTYNILSGATAQMQLSGRTGGDSLPTGSLVGDSTTTVNFKVINTTNLRWNNNSFAGTINYQSNDGSSARVVNLTNFVEGGNKTGTGTTNFANLVRATMAVSNDMNDTGTLQLTGSSGGASNVKFAMGGNSDTIGNFVIDSPTGATASAPTLQGSAALTVSGTTTFQGTAGNVNFDSSNASPSSHNLITTGSMTFGGTGTWAVAGDGVIRLNAGSGTRTITTNTNASIANTLAGSQGFTKQGASTLTLTGTNTYTGGTTINAGTLSFANGSLGTTGNISFDGNSTLQWNGTNTQDVSSRIVMSNSVTSTFDTNGNDVSFASGIGSSTSGALTKAGSGKLTLDANATYTGVTTISGGTLEVKGSLASSGITNNSALIYNNAADQTYANAIGGSGSLTKQGVGKLTLNANAGYAGVTTISGGTLEVKGSLASSGITNNSALIYNNAGDQSYAGVIGGSGSLTKEGAGKLTLTGDNSYGGSTTINAGMLEIGGTGDINSTTGITIASGAQFKYNSSTALSGVSITNNGGTISGTGTIGVAVSMDSTDDVIAPGNSPGIQPYGTGQTWSSFTYEWELNDWVDSVAGTDYDQIAITGGLTLSGGSGSYVLDILSLDSLNASGLVGAGGGNPFTETSRSWTILTTTTGIAGFNAANWTINPAGFLDTEAGTWGLSQSGNNLVLNYTAAIPEPGAALLGGLGMLALLRRRRQG